VQRREYYRVVAAEELGYVNQVPDAARCMTPFFA
jgi:hypothetical protein